MRLIRFATFVFVAFALIPGLVLAQTAPSFINQWGSLGTGPGQLAYPYGAAVSADGSVYVTDQYNYRIEQFGPMGGLLRTWGSQGAGPGMFGKTIGICVAPDGDVYVADYDNSRVQVFTSAGGFIRSIAGIMAPRDVIVANDGTTFVAVDNSNVVEVHDLTGALLRNIGKGQVGRVTSVAIASDGALLVTDIDYRHRGIWRFDPSTGVALGFWPISAVAGVAYGGPHSITVAPSGTVYACDYGNAIVAVLSPTGDVIGSFGGIGSAPGQLQSAADAAVGPDGSVYVVDLLGSRIVHYGFGVTAAKRETWGALKTTYAATGISK